MNKPKRIGMFSLYAASVIFAAIALSFFITCATDEDELDLPPGSPCTATEQCDPNSVCYNGICVTAGALRFSLSWNVLSDFDLHVKTPNGNEIYFGNRQADGGMLDVDDCISNECVTSGTHVENVYFTSAAPRGTYTYWVVNFNGSTSGTYTLEVFVNGVRVETKTGTLPASSGAESPKYTYQY